MRRAKSVHISAHPSLYQAMEELGRKFKEKNGIGLSQTEATKIIAQNFRIPKIPDLFKLDLKRKKC
jgi:hypothetical protein